MTTAASVTSSTEHELAAALLAWLESIAMGTALLPFVAAATLLVQLEREQVTPIWTGLSAAAWLFTIWIGLANLLPRQRAP